MSAAKLLSLFAILASMGCKSSPEPASAESGAPMPSGGQTSVAETPAVPASGIATYDENVHEIVAAVGKPFMLSLPANITTPYKWVVDSTVDPTAFELVKDEYSATPPAGCTGCVGSGGKRLMTFQAKRAGALTLSLRYQSITDPKEAPANTFQATVQAK